MKLSAYKRVYLRFGFISLLHDMLVGIGSKLFHIQIFLIYKLSRASQCPDMDAGVEIRRLFSRELCQYACPELELTPEYVADSAKNGGQCFGAFLDQKLCAYGWYASSPAVFSDDEQACFSDEYVYGYKEFTLNNFRGRGFQKAIKFYALRHFLKDNKSGVILAIESHNFSSRRCTERLGSVIIGFRVVFKAKGKSFGLHSPGCKTVGFKVLKN